MTMGFYVPTNKDVKFPAELMIEAAPTIIPADGKDIKVPTREEEV